MSFKIVCNKCGEEIVFEDNFEGVGEEMIYIYSTMNGRIVIECMECGNNINSKQDKILEDVMDCNKCKNLNITEKEQTNKKEDHMCLKYNRRVLHNNFRGKEPTERLYPCVQCCDDNYMHYEER